MLGGGSIDSGGFDLTFSFFFSQQSLCYRFGGGANPANPSPVQVKLSLVVGEARPAGEIHKLAASAVCKQISKGEVKKKIIFLRCIAIRTQSKKKNALMVEEIIEGNKLVGCETGNKMSE